VDNSSPVDERGERVAIMEQELATTNIDMDRLIVENDKLIWYVMKKFRVPQNERDDFHSIGVFGLIEAARKFDLSRGTKFSTFAVPHIFPAIQKEFRRRRAKRRTVTAAIISLDDHFDDEDGLQYQNILPDLNVNVEQTCIANVDNQQTLSLLYRAMADWHERDRTILIMFGEGKTQLEIANHIGISQVQVGRIIPKLLSRAKYEIERGEAELTEQRQIEAEQQQIESESISGHHQSPLDTPNAELLVLKNRGLIWHLLKKFPAKDREDLYDVGLIGLIKAAQTFDTSRGIKFATYASRCIMNEILIDLRKQRKLVKPSVNLDTFVTDEGEKPLYDIVADPNVNVEQEIADHDEHSQRLYLLSEVLTNWSERDRTILLMHGKGMDQHEIAMTVRVSQSYISRLIPKLVRRAQQEVEIKQKQLVRSRRAEAEATKVELSSNTQPANERGNGQMKFTLTREEYLQKRVSGMNKSQIAAQQSIHIPTLYYWLDKWELRDKEVEQAEIQRIQLTTATPESKIKAELPNDHPTNVTPEQPLGENAIDANVDFHVQNSRETSTPVTHSTKSKESAPTSKRSVGWG
jgi:RNA polymerase sporulation-specific sigma factor